MASKRIDKIKKSRSLNELFSVVREIAKEFADSRPSVDTLIKSLSGNALAKRVGKSLSAGELNIDRTGKKAPPKVDVVKWVAPKVTDLRKNIAVINDLYENTEELDYAMTMIKQVFSDNPNSKKALAEMQKLRDSIQEKLDSCFAVLDDIASKHLPPKARQMFDEMLSDIITYLPSNLYKDINQEIYVIPNPEETGSFMFCMYCDIEKLKNKAGYVYDLFCVTLTGIISKEGHLKFYANAFPNFKVPGRYPIGKEVTDKASLMKHLGLLFTHNDLVVELDKMPLPVDEQGAQNLGLTKIKNVASVKVVKDELIVVLTSDLQGAARDKVVSDILARLGSLLGMRNNKSLFTYKFGKVAGKPSIKFVLVPNIDKSDKKVHINSAKLDEVAEVFGLSDQQKKAFRVALIS